VAKLLRRVADDLDSGNSKISDSEAADIMETVCHREISKAQVCNYLNTGRSNFDSLIREGKMPKGKKVVGFKELRWYKDEIDACLKELKSKNKNRLL
jgi:predicted DNA-binding transcriptional regulator AlpA